VTGGLRHDSHVADGRQLAVWGSKQPDWSELALSNGTTATNYAAADRMAPRHQPNPRRLMPIACTAALDPLCIWVAWHICDRLGWLGIEYSQVVEPLAAVWCSSSSPTLLTFDRYLGPSPSQGGQAPVAVIVESTGRLLPFFAVASEACRRSCPWFLHASSPKY
jgi:hypothetical protein